MFIVINMTTIIFLLRNISKLLSSSLWFKKSKNLPLDWETKIFFPTKIH